MVCCWSGSRVRAALTNGQRKAYTNLSCDGRLTIIAVSGIIARMTPSYVKLFRNGRQSSWDECSQLDEIGQICSRWEWWALQQPWPPEIDAVPDLTKSPV